MRDDVYDAATGRIDMARLKPLGRLAGQQYAHIHDIFEMKRPDADKGPSTSLGPSAARST